LDGGKITKRTHLNQIIKTYKTLKKDSSELEEELYNEPPPNETIYLLNWFYELKRSEVLTFSEIQNWATLYRRPIKSYQVEVLMDLDNIYRSVSYGS
jgi:hypothetical protein